MKSGFVVILGRPNVGKSTLLNSLVGSKVAIVTHRPQTTRDAIQGVVTRPEGQIVFVDSPGIHEPRRELGKHMMREVRRAASGCHLVVVVVDAGAPSHRGDKAAMELARGLRVPALLVLNKIDLLKSKLPLLPHIERYRELETFDEFVPLSARRGENTDLLLKLIFERLPEAPAFYDEDYITDQPERFLAAELIREQVIKQTQQEVPHSIAVLIEKWVEKETSARSPKRKSIPMLRLSATIYVERAGQKGIMIGAGGEKLKQIGTFAREQLEISFGRKVFLELFIKVRPKWRDQPTFIQSLDFHRLLGSDDTG